MTMIATLLHLALLVGPPQAPTGDAVLELIPLPQACLARTPAPVPPWGSLLQVRTEEVALLGDGAAPVPAEDLVALLAALHREAVDGGDLRLELRGPWLLASGSAPVTTQVRRQVADLDGLASRAVRIDVALWPAIGATPPAFLGPSEFAAWRQERHALAETSVHTHAGTPTAVRRQTWQRYVRDVDCEVAQKAKIPSPITDAYGEGLAALVTTHTLAGSDDLVVMLQFAVGAARGAPRTVATGVPDSADLELPLLETAYGAASGRIRNGGALLLTLRGHPSAGGSFVLTVRATTLQPAPTAPSGCGIWPLGALVEQGLLRGVTPPPAMPRIGDEQSGVERSESTPGQLSTDDVHALLQQALGSAADACAIAVHGDLLVARGDAAHLRVVDTTLLALQDRVLGNATLHHTGRLRRRDAAASFEAPLLLHEITLPTLLGRIACAARCLETNAVRDVFVEIAQSASITNPCVDRVQSGAWVEALAAAGPTGLRAGIRLQCTHTAIAEPRPIRPTGMLMPEGIASTSATHDGIAAAEQPIEHGDGPAVALDGVAYRSALVTMLR
jgi:hypothetical protein